MPLTTQQVQQYRDHGVVIAEDILTDADLAPVIAAVERHVETRARKLQTEGRITDLGEGLDYKHRLVHLYRQCPEINAGLDIMQMQAREVFEFLFNKNLLDAVEGIVGSEITCNPIQHLRAKMPACVTGEQKAGYFELVPWHQDAAVTWEEADPTDIVTVWIPLVDATAETGCMQVLPDVFRRGYLEHQAEGGTTIKPDLFPRDVEPVTAECRRGGAVFMNKYTPHCGIVNNSRIVRWSIDLRYQKTGMPTGRPFWPSFIVRSRSNPASVQNNYEQWKQRWNTDLERARGIKWHRTVPADQRMPAGV